MIRIEGMIFNPFQANTYFLWDETAECIVVDPACYEENEKQLVKDFLSKNKLTLVRNLNTHCHFDHILGNDFIAETFHIHPEYHKNSLPFISVLHEMASSFGISIDKIPEPARFLEDNEVIHWGNSSLKVLFTPGHAEGSVSFYQEEQRFVITGDVLFRETIGRTDLLTGDFDQLMNSIKNRLFKLPEETRAYPGHGPETSIGYEMNNNPFIR